MTEFWEGFLWGLGVGAVVGVVPFIWVMNSISKSFDRAFGYWR